MFKTVFSAVLALGIMSGSALACQVTETMGAPQSSDHNQLYNLCRLGYQSMFNPVTKTPRWVAEDLKAENIGGDEERGSWFKEDPDLPKGVGPDLDDYKGARLNGWVLARGHMAPAENFSRNKEMMKQSFLLTNMAPQVQRCNNSGIWSKLERMERDWTVHYGQMFVVNGPIYRGGEPTIGNGVVVPSAFFKAIANPTRKEILVFIVANVEHCGVEVTEKGKTKRVPVQPREFVTSLADVEAQTGLKLFPKLEGYVNVTTIWP